MTTNHKDLGKKIAGTIHSGIETAERFWTIISEEILDHLRKYLDLAEVVDVVHMDKDSHDADDIDAMIMVYTEDASGSKTVTLPDDPTSGRLIAVKDAGGHAERQNIEVQAGSHTIDGESVDVIDYNHGASSYTFHDGAWRKLTTSAQASAFEIVEIVEITSDNETLEDKDLMAVVSTDSTSGSWTVYLPDDPTEGRFITVKDGEGHADNQNITIRGNGQDIDGSGSQTITEEYGSFSYIFDGQEWRQVNEGSGDGGSGDGGSGIQHLPVSGYQTADNTGWSVIGRVRFADDDFDINDGITLVVECDASDDSTGGEVELYDVTSGSASQEGSTQTFSGFGPHEVTITVSQSSSPGDDRIFELRAQVDGGDDDERVIVWSSYMLIE